MANVQLSFASGRSSLRLCYISATAVWHTHDRC